MYLLLALAGCPRRGPDDAARLEALLAEADRAWERRGDTGLDGAARPLLDAWSVSPDHPEVGWRLVRWRLTEGLAAPEPGQARSSYAQARELAIECLDADALFAQRRLGEGWRVALAELAPEREPCAAWAALAWARWLEALGGGAAALDLDAVDALVGAATGADDQGVRGVARWAEGLLAAARPVWAGRDLRRAEAALEDAVRADPHSVVRRADLYAVAPDAGLRREILAMEARAPEDVLARERVETYAGRD